MCNCELLRTVTAVLTINGNFVLSHFLKHKQWLASFYARDRLVILFCLPCIKGKVTLIPVYASGSTSDCGYLGGQSTLFRGL